MAPAQAVPGDSPAASNKPLQENIGFTWAGRRVGGPQHSCHRQLLGNCSGKDSADTEARHAKNLEMLRHCSHHALDFKRKIASNSMETFLIFFWRLGFLY